jgi:hypothetical protein
LSSRGADRIRPCSSTLSFFLIVPLFGRESRFTILFLLLSHVLTASDAHVKRELTLTWEEGAPNGQSRHMIRANGQFPSLTLIFDEGDDVEVRSLSF